MSEWELTEESFNLFLSWLDPDRDAAAKKYEDIQRRLIVLFDSRGCARSEELADETINRVIRRLPEMLDTYTGDPFAYLRVVARYIYLEQVKKQTLPLPEGASELPAPREETDEEPELLHDCLDSCLERLKPGDRALVLDYYRKDKQAKINFRKELAERLGLSANALRIKVHHIRAALHQCIDACVAVGRPEMK